MKKVYKVTGLDCANCAAKIETAIGKLAGVQEISVNVLTQKLILHADEVQIDGILEQAQKICTKIEPGSMILAK